MIEVTVAYPAGEGRTFDMDYYLKTHIPLAEIMRKFASRCIQTTWPNPH
jgi:hypothetical protein